MEAVQKEMTEAINKATADHELRMRQLQDRVDAMERTVNEVVAKNKEEEQRMRKVWGSMFSQARAPFLYMKAYVPLAFLSLYRFGFVSFGFGLVR
jgi:uncharacterized coiled-coil protein SlyX